MVVIDPRRTPTADRADLALQPVPGTDLALALGVLHLLVAADAVDEDYLAARTTGWGRVKDSVASWWPERVERVTGISAAEVRELAAYGFAPEDDMPVGLQIMAPAFADDRLYRVGAAFEAGRK